MPHCIIEYSSPLQTTQSPTALIKAVHLGASNSGLFNPKDIKVRSTAYEDCQIGDNEAGSFVHVMARILAGRTDEQKTKLSAAIYAELLALNLTLDALTVEVCDIHRASHQPCPD